MRQNLHAPAHNVTDAGAFIITAATLYKENLFNSPQALDLLEEIILQSCGKYGWRIQQWAVFPNHYHFVALSPADNAENSILTRRIHGRSAIRLNQLKGTPGRTTWYQRWDTRITSQRSYFARLNYVQQNPVHHKIVACATDYKWCSAAWFKENSEPKFFKTVCDFKIDKVKVVDDF